MILKTRSNSFAAMPANSPYSREMCSCKKAIIQSLLNRYRHTFSCVAVLNFGGRGKDKELRVKGYGVGGDGSGPQR